MKKLFNISFALIFLTTLFCSTSVMAEDTIGNVLNRGKLMIGLDAGYMPFEMRSKKGKIIGFDVDLAKELAKSMGVKLEIVNTAFDGIIPALQTKKFDIIVSGMTVTQQRNLKVNFSNPYITVGQTILLNKKHKGKVNSWKDLNNSKYTLVSKLGTTGELAVKRLLRKAKYISFETEQEGIQEVTNSNADAFIYDLPYNAIMATTKSKGKLIHLDEPFTYEPLAFGVRKGDPDMINFLNNFLLQIKNDGRYDRIYAKWFKSSKWQKRVQ